MRALVPVLFCLLLTACGDQPDRQWETTSSGAYSASLSPDGQYALIGSVEHGGSLWRMKDGERLYNWNHAAGEYSRIVATAFSRDSRFALTAERKRFVMWEVASGKAMGFWPAEGGVLDMALSDDGRFALIGQENYSALYIDTRSGTIISTLNHSGDINAVDISGDGRIGVTGSEDGIVKVWDLPQGKVTFAYQLGDDVSSVALSHDAKLVFGGLYYGKGKVWEVRTGKEVSSLGFNRTTITQARFAADNKSLLTGFTARRMVLWNVRTGKILRNWRAQAPLFWRPSGLVVDDVAFGSKKGEYWTIFSNGLTYRW
jgi:hypothetical protein